MKEVVRNTDCRPVLRLTPPERRGNVEASRQNRAGGGTMDLLRGRVLIEWDPEDRVWATYVPEMNWLSTYGDTLEEAMDRTREAILGYLEAAEKGLRGD